MNEYEMLAETRQQIIADMLSIYGNNVDRETASQEMPIFAQRWASLDDVSLLVNFIELLQNGVQNLKL